MARVNRFQTGSGVYTCRCCNKQTRETGDGESGVQLCLPCYDLAGLENEHNDRHHSGTTDADCDWCKGVRSMDYCTHSFTTPFLAEVAQCTLCYAYFAESDRDGNTLYCPHCKHNDRIYRTWMTKEVAWLDHLTPADPAVVKRMEEEG